MSLPTVVFLVPAGVCVLAWYGAGSLVPARLVPGGSRLLDGQVTAVQQSIGAPKNRQAAAAYLRGFVEDVKRSGMVRRLVESHGVKGVNVAPPA